MGSPQYIIGLRGEFSGAEIKRHFGERAKHHALQAENARDGSPVSKREHLAAEWFAVAELHISNGQTYLLSREDLDAMEWFGVEKGGNDG